MLHKRWQKLRQRSFGLALLAVLLLVFMPVLALYFSTAFLFDFPFALLLFAVGLPLCLILLSLAKDHAQDILDRRYEVDEEDRLQRYAHPKFVRSFPVRPVFVKEAHWSSETNPEDGATQTKNVS